jgi:hypothetical protein
MRQGQKNGNANGVVDSAAMPIAAGNPNFFTSLLLWLKRALCPRCEIIGKICAWR